MAAGELRAALWLVMESGKVGRWTGGTTASDATPQMRTLTPFNVWGKTTAESFLRRACEGGVERWVDWGRHASH